MKPDWSVQPLSSHITVSDPDTAIQAKNIRTASIGTYQVKETRITVPITDGQEAHAIVREPVGAPDNHAACIFLHGAGTGKAEEVYADISGALASSGMTTLVQDKRLDNYTALHRDYEKSAQDYMAGIDVLKHWDGVDATKVGLYAESEGTWIASLVAEQEPDLAFAALISAPVYSARKQMAMAATEYLHIIGAPNDVLQLIPRITSLKFGIFDLNYADFNAREFRNAYTMPLLITYGTLDPSMPIEQGALQLLEDAQSVGNSNAVVRYYPTNHQMRTGSSLSVPGLPLAEHYTRDLASWMNAVAAGASAEDWTTPMIAGSQPYQEYAVPSHTTPGLIKSVNTLLVLLAFSVLFWIATVVLCIMSVIRHRRAITTTEKHGKTIVHRFATGTKVLVISNIVVTPLITAGFFAYIAFVGMSALSLSDHGQMLSMLWTALRVAVIISVMLLAWMWVRLFFFYGPGNIDPDTPKDQRRLSRGHNTIIACCSICVLCSLILACFFNMLG